MDKKDFTILYVDDEIHNLTSFNATFRREYRIITAISGKEGIRCLRENEVHLVITDQRMPGMTGVEFLEKILPEYPETIRMILTAYSDIEAVIGAINKGQVYRYINKPWDAREMRMTIENARHLYGLKEENIRSQFEALKNQINPHFLFNNLNILSSLIFIDQEAAGKYIRQLSRVYRYVLDMKNSELVLLDDELRFLDSYTFLLKMRYGDNLVITYDIPDEMKVKKIAPVVMQMLFENAIKHNVVSNKKPLHISITSKDHSYLSVKNNLQPKSSVQISSRIGLDNIKRRYRFLTSRKVIIKKTLKSFEVKIPLL